MKIAIYAENCAMAGRECYNQKLIDSESQDIVIYEGTEEEILAIANRIEKYNDRHNLYKVRVVETLRDRIADEISHESGKDQNWNRLVQDSIDLED